MPTKAINLRIDTELLEYLQARADYENRTLSNMIISILTDEKERKNDDLLIHSIKHQLYARYMDNPSEVKALFEMIDNLQTVRKQNYEMLYSADGKGV